ncbi:unnamed protein product [Heligmosomoides polygyrus]|uniref:Transposase n=1 Tax=Heligmosomoides polygyrus TaxID=6339 RepID=A0A183GH30_HELPZ|nr:unnamed protein product [Heligmosomoides polygyrus]
MHGCVRACANCIVVGLAKSLHSVETWPIRKQDEHAISVAQRGIEKTILGVTRLTQVREGLRSSEVRRRTEIGNAVAWANSSNVRWASLVMRFADTRWKKAVTYWIPWDVKRTAGCPPTLSSEFFVNELTI